MSQKELVSLVETRMEETTLALGQCCRTLDLYFSAAQGDEQVNG